MTHPTLDPRTTATSRDLYAYQARRLQELNAERAAVTSEDCRAECPAGPHAHTAWDGLLLQPAYEALAETDPVKQLAALVQLAGVCAAMIHDRQTA